MTHCNSLGREQLTFAAPATTTPTTSFVTSRVIQRGEALRIDQHSGIVALRMAKGVAWITGTPGDEDVLLSSGEAVVFGDGWPYVIEALGATDAVLSLTQKKPITAKTRGSYFR